MAVDDESEATCAVRMGTRARAGCGDVRVDVLLTRSANAGTDAIRAMDIKRWRARGISDEGNNARWETREFVSTRDEKERRDGLIDFAFRSIDHAVTLIVKLHFSLSKYASRRRGEMGLQSWFRAAHPRRASSRPRPHEASSEGRETHLRRHLRGRLNPRPGAHHPRRTNPPRVTTHRRQ